MLRSLARRLSVNSATGANRNVQWPPFWHTSKTSIYQFRSHNRLLSLNRLGDYKSKFLMAKRKIHSVVTNGPSTTATPTPISPFDDEPPPKRRASQRKVSQAKSLAASTNPDVNANVLDAVEALRASPDADEPNERMDAERAGMDVKKQIKDEDQGVSLIDDRDSDSALSDISDLESPVKTEEIKPKIGASKGSKNGKSTHGKEPAPLTKAKETVNQSQFLDPEAEGDEEAGEEEIQAALSRSPPVNSDYLPLPWKGRLGYACLCTYLRFSNPPVFSSRTCRIASILENRHPLKDPNEPPHATKNRPDKDQPASIKRGQAFVESLGLANARDIVKMLRWNDRYGIKFFRLSSEMFPFASHEEYGYKLAPFAAEALAEAGRLAAELGHRLTTHPGQFTQLGSPRKQVITSSIRDLEFHSELLSLLKLPPQQNRDAVMILHLGGVFGDKAATLDRFRENYKQLTQDIKNRLVLENDDMSWSVHDLLPLCEELNIPMVLDFHHHNIIFDADQIREGTKDIIELYPRILATWQRKKITPKMHYSEPRPSAITGNQRRKHSPRVTTLPPCPPTMDLMIEAKDKEQAVFELMRNFKLPGYDTFTDMIPHVRNDDNKVTKTPKKKPQKKTKKENADDEDVDEPEEEPVATLIEAGEVGMGGPQGRVYWPPGMEHWLRPVKKIIKPRTTLSATNEQQNQNKTATLAKRKRKTPAIQLNKNEVNNEHDGPDHAGSIATTTERVDTGVNGLQTATPAKDRKQNAKKTPNTKKTITSVVAPEAEGEEETENLVQGDTRDETTTTTRKSKRATRKKRLRYVVGEM